MTRTTASLLFMTVSAVVVAIIGIADSAMRGGAPTAPAAGSLGGSIRDRVARIALGAVGLTASGDPTPFEEFLGGPGEAAGTKHDMALNPLSSTCGLVARAILRLAGFTDPRLFAPYRIGQAISDLIAMAKEAGAWIVPGPGVPPPQKGDVIFGDVDKPSGHVWTLTSADAAALTFESADGGAVDAQGHQSVAARTRRWTQSGAIVIDTPSFGNQHRITGWLDVEKLAAAQGLAA